MKIGLFLFLSVAYSSQQNQEEATVFSCEGRVTGYYADIQSGCRMYHYCFGSNQYTYECPNNTLFQQRSFICNHWYLVDCENSERFYSANLLIGQKNKYFVADEDVDVTPPPTLTRTVFTTAKPTLQPNYTPGNETYDYNFKVNSTLSVEYQEIQRVEQQSTILTTPSTSTTKQVLREGKSNGDDGFIRLKFSDPRGLFFIPSDNNTLETISTNIREFLIRRTNDKDEVMQFKEHIDGVGGGIVCPKYCNPRFLKRGTCHPCIMIK